MFVPRKVKLKPIHFQSKPMAYIHCSIKILLLYLFGNSLCFLILNLLQEYFIIHFSSRYSWIPVTCGFSFILLSLTINFLDRVLGVKCRHSWSLVLQCLGAFVGINFAACKLHWFQDSKLSLAIAILAMAFWFKFDKTFNGFLLSTLVASIGTCFTTLLAQNGVYRFPKSDLFGIPSWIPWILYSSCILCGCMGRKLDILQDFVS